MANNEVRDKSKIVANGYKPSTDGVAKAKLQMRLADKERPKGGSG